MTYDEREVLKNLAGEDQEAAFSLFYRKHRTKALAVIKRALPDPILAHDALQETFIALWLKRKELSEIRNMESFVYAIAKTQALYQLYLQGRQVTNFERFGFEISLEVSTEEKIEMDMKYMDRLEQLRIAASGLPKAQKQVFVLAKINGLSYEQIAQNLHISPHTVKGSMVGALNNLRKALNLPNPS